MGNSHKINRIRSTRIPEEPPLIPPVISLTATPSTVNSDGSTILEWSSTDATSCTPSGDWSASGIIDTSGTLLINNLTSNNTYTLTCTGSGGSTSKSVTVTVVGNDTAAPINNDLISCVFKWFEDTYPNYYSKNNIIDFANTGLSISGVYTSSYYDKTDSVLSYSSADKIVYSGYNKYEYSGFGKYGYISNPYEYISIGSLSSWLAVSGCYKDSSALYASESVVLSYYLAADKSSNKDTPIPTSISEVLNSKNHSEALLSYLSSKKVDQALSTAMSTLHSAIVYVMPDRYFYKYTGNSGLMLERALLRTFDALLADQNAYMSTVRKVNAAGGSVLKGFALDVLITAVADNFKADFKRLIALDTSSTGGVYLDTFLDYGIDIYFSALKNAAASVLEAPEAFVLSFQIGFVSDMTAMSGKKFIDALLLQATLSLKETQLARDFVENIQDAQVRIDKGRSLSQLAQSKQTSDHDRKILEAKSKHAIQSGNESKTLLARDLMNRYGIPENYIGYAREVMFIALKVKENFDKGNLNYESFDVMTKEHVNNLGKLNDVNANKARKALLDLLSAWPKVDGFPWYWTTLLTEN